MKMRKDNISLVKLMGLPVCERSKNVMVMQDFVVWVGTAKGFYNVYLNTEDNTMYVKLNDRYEELNNFNIRKIEVLEARIIAKKKARA